MISWFQDLRYAIRSCRKSPGFTVAAILTPAMAIGANAVVFGVMNGLILRPLDVPQAQSLYASSAPATRIWLSPIPTISICGNPRRSTQLDLSEA